MFYFKKTKNSYNKIKNSPYKIRTVFCFFYFDLEGLLILFPILLCLSAPAWLLALAWKPFLWGTGFLITPRLTVKSELFLCSIFFRFFNTLLSIYFNLNIIKLYIISKKFTRFLSFTSSFRTSKTTLTTKITTTSLILSLTTSSTTITTLTTKVLSWSRHASFWYKITYRFTSYNR